MRSTCFSVLVITWLGTGVALMRRALSVSIRTRPRTCHRQTRSRNFRG
jgi:hypothetical protein